MTIKTDLIKGYISDIITSELTDFEIDEEKIINTIATKALKEIQDIVTNSNYSDFEIVEKIVCIFEKYNIDAGNCHDF